MQIPRKDQSSSYNPRNKYYRERLQSLDELFAEWLLYEQGQVPTEAAQWTDHSRLRHGLNN